MPSNQNVYFWVLGENRTALNARNEIEVDQVMATRKGHQRILMTMGDEQHTTMIGDLGKFKFVGRNFSIYRLPESLQRS